MDDKKLQYKGNPPCGMCPYKQGLIEAFKNPCPECKTNHYQTYERFKKLPYMGKTMDQGDEVLQEDI